MHFSSLSRPAAVFSLFLLLSPVPAASVLQCDHIQADSASFNLKTLGGPHSVVTSRWQPPSDYNTSYTVDICKGLKRKGEVTKGDQCPDGTRVCAIERTINKGEGADTVGKVIPIAGELQDYGGKEMDVTYERLKTSESDADKKKEGVRIIMSGSNYPLDGPAKERRPQKAIIEFICDPDKSGLEGETAPEDQYETETQNKRRDDDKKDDDENKGKSTKETQTNREGASLLFESYGPSEKGDIDILRLTWLTKYACEDAWKNPPADDDKPPGDSSSHWGFFTWAVVITFLGIAAYLIFGSWLNYNRYGARGWDLLPHGDTIRDIPYLFKDWMRSVLNTVQGSGSRGGYSAV